MSIELQPLPLASATSASAKSLAHEPIAVGQIYPLVGELRATLRAIAYVVEHLGDVLSEHTAQAHDEGGDPVRGRRHAEAAIETLGDVARRLEEIETDLDAVSVAAGRIVWTAPEPSRRWVNIVFLQGEEADAVLDLIDQRGPEAAIEHLKQWDFGDETTDAALVNGYVYDAIPAGATDRVAESDSREYVITYSAAHGHVSLLRQRSSFGDPEPIRDCERSRSAIGSQLPPLVAVSGTDPSRRTRGLTR